MLKKRKKSNKYIKNIVVRCNIVSPIHVPGGEVFEYLEWDGYLLTTMAVVVRTMALVLRTMAVVLHVY